MNNDLLAAGLSGFGLGAGLIIAIGAQNAYVLRAGLRRQHVLAVTSVCFLVDCILIALGAGGFASLIAAFPGLPAVAAWGGALFLFIYGLRALRAALRSDVLTPARAGGADAGGRRQAIATALALSLLNPHVYLDTVILLGGIAASHPPRDRTAFAAGAITASAFWFYALGFGASRLAPLFASPTAWRLLDAAIAAVMWSIAASLVWDRLAAQT